MSQGLDLAWDASQQAICDSVATYCRDHCTPEALRESAGGFPAPLWRGLAELGVLALATPEGGGGAQEVAAAMESLGRATHPGPLVETFFATQLLPDAERARVAAGDAVVTVGEPPLLVWASCADLFVACDGDGAWLAEARGAVEPVAMLGGEPWGRVELLRRSPLGDATRARALADLAQAADLAAAGCALIDAAAEHARTRQQFGRAIGSFQAVAHPLADAAIALDAAATLARVAAWEWDASAAGAPVRAAIARHSASRAARHAAHVAHQVFGALGITLAGPAFALSRRIVQRSLPDPRADSLLLASIGFAEGA